MSVSYITVTGEEIKKLANTLSSFRKSAFLLPPYSYCFSEETEKQYLKEYISHKQSCLIYAEHQGKIVGVISGLPLSSASSITKNAAFSFRQCRRKPSTFFYICEVIVLPDFRRKNIGQNLMQRAEAYAKSLLLNNTCLLSIKTDRAGTHKQDFWLKLGYKLTSMSEFYHWPTYNENGKKLSKKHELIYWIKENVS